MCLGNYFESLIYVLTFGYGKPLATFIAHKLGYASCGCLERKNWLNKLGRCDDSIDLTKL